MLVLSVLLLYLDCTVGFEIANKELQRSWRPVCQRFWNTVWPSAWFKYGACFLVVNVSCGLVSDVLHQNIACSWWHSLIHICNTRSFLPLIRPCLQVHACTWKNFCQKVISDIVQLFTSYFCNFYPSVPNGYCIFKLHSSMVLLS